MRKGTFFYTTTLGPSCSHDTDYLLMGSEYERDCIVHRKRERRVLEISCHIIVLVVEVAAVAGIQTKSNLWCRTTSPFSRIKFDISVGIVEHRKPTELGNG